MLHLVLNLTEGDYRRLAARAALLLLRAAHLEDGSMVYEVARTFIAIAPEFISGFAEVGLSGPVGTSVIAGY
jgi:hypothetical protein